MAPKSSLDETVGRMLASQTFEPAELAKVLVERGHDRGEVDAAIARATAELERDAASPANERALVLRRRGARLLRLGIMTLAAGTAFTLYFRAGFIQLLLVIAIGGALIGAGYRALRHAARSSTYDGGGG